MKYTESRGKLSDWQHTNVLNESQLINSLKNLSGLVSYDNVTRVDGETVIHMSFEGVVETLEQHVKRGGITDPTKFVSYLSEQLDAMHKVGVIHRGIRAEAIIVERGIPRLVGMQSSCLMKTCFSIRSSAPNISWRGCL